MIYLNNNTEQQTIYIPRNGVVAENRHSGYALQSKSYRITENGRTVITPDQGFVGISAGTIDVEVESGGDYDQGYADGFASGETVGYASGYTSGETDGYASGYTSGVTDGVAEQKALLSSTALTENGMYTNENGWNEVEVQIPIGSMSTIINENGVHTYTVPESLKGWAQLSIDVEVPQNTGGTLVLGALIATANSNYFPAQYGCDAFSAVTVSVDTTQAYNSGYTAGYTDGYADGQAQGTGITGYFGAEAVYENVSGVTTLYSVSGNTLIGMSIDGGQVIQPSDTYDFGETVGTHIVTYYLNSPVLYMHFGNNTASKVTFGNNIYFGSSVSMLLNRTIKSVYLPQTLTKLPTSSFASCNSLKTIELPDTLTEIGSNTFNGSGLSVIISKATTAPTLGNDVFGNLINQSGTLFVPTGSDYSSWVSELPSGWTVSYL